MQVITKRASGRAAANRKSFWNAINSILAAPYDPTGSLDGKPGDIMAINASLIAEGSFQKELSIYATGWKDSDGILDLENEFFGPAVQAPDRFEYEQFDNAEQFYSDMNEDKRAQRSEFKSVEYTSEKIKDATENRGLMIMEENKKVTQNGSQYYVDMLMRRLKRNKLRRKLALLLAAATNTAKTWDTTDGKSPDADVMGDLVTAGDNSGLKPNRVGFGMTAWQKRFLCCDAQKAPGNSQRANWTPDQLRMLYAVDKVLRSEVRYTSSAAARTQVLDNIVVMFTAMSNPDLEDPSNIKDFWSPCENGGGQYAVMQWSIGSKFQGIAVEHNEAIRLPSVLGIRKLTIS